MTSYLISGDDPALVSEALSGLLEELTSEELTGGAFVPVEEHGTTGSDDSLDIGPVLDALSTPPFLADRRLVVLRGAEGLNATQAGELAERVKNPLEGNVLVLVATGKVPAALSKAFKTAGTVLDTSPGGNTRQRADWFADRLRHAAVHLDAAAARRLGEHLGEDVGRLQSVLETLESAYGTGGRVTAEELDPFLGEWGGVPPWDLTDAIDKGETAAALDALHRMMGPGDRHPLQLLAVLHRHFGAMLRLDGAGVKSGDEAAGLLKMSPFPARKALEQSRRLGHERIGRAIEVLADADFDLRGNLDWPSTLVMEVLVARLAQLGRQTAAPSPASRSSRATRR
jgi:DNA polymerase-3 subunit delta